MPKIAVKIPIAIVGYLLIAGCTSVSGTQKRLTKDYVARFGAVCPSEDQLRAAHAPETDAAYRDRVIMVCVKAINARYVEFTEQLSTESTGVNLISDVAAQSLATAASLVTKAKLAGELAAASALSVGLGASINKSLFYEQTLPALLASMDARRSKVLTSIVESQNRDREAKVYTLARAGADLDLLEQAGSITSAVRELTSSAVENANEANTVLQAAQREIDIGIFVANTPSDILARVRGAADLVRRLEAADNRAVLLTLAQSLGHQPPANGSPTYLGGLIRGTIAGVTTIPVDQQASRMNQIEALLAPYRGISS